MSRSDDILDKIKSAFVLDPEAERKKKEEKRELSLLPYKERSRQNMAKLYKRLMR